MKKKKVGVISGKGGVGKTSLVASLAYLTENDRDINSIVIDCDVDAPNLALILSPSSNNNLKRKDVYSTLKASFQKEKCTQCKRCIDDHFCEFNALSWDFDNNIPLIDYLSCEGCGACRLLCQGYAFEINPVISGEIIYYISNIGIPIVYGKTRLGSTTSGKLVTECKSYIEKLDGLEKINLIMIDGPPGIGCPVIATISGLDYLIIVTEPTPSGLHDLKRAIELVQDFKIPFGIVINKFNIDTPFQVEFKKYFNETGFDIIGKIPFDLTIPEAMSYTKTVIEFNYESEASKAIKNIYTRMKNILWNEI